MVSRFIENISFGISTFMFIMKQRNVDIVYANVWPVFSLGFVVLACKIRRIKVIASIQDLYPESLVVQKRLTNRSVLYRILLALDSFIVRRCNKIIVISEGFKKIQIKDRGVDEDRISVIRNWVKSDMVTVLDKTSARAELNSVFSMQLSEDDFVCVYGGNMGVASGLDNILSDIGGYSARIVFILAGDGSLVPELKDIVVKQGLENNVKFIVPWPSELTSVVFAAADLLLLPIAKGQEFASVPSKLITYMLSSRPIMLLASNSSESAIELDKSCGGFCVESRTGAAISAGLDWFMQLSPQERIIMGNSGRHYAEEFYSSGIALKKIDDIFQSLI